VSYGIAVETSEGLTDLTAINDGRATLNHIVTTRNSGSISIPTTLSSGIIVVSALNDPIPNGFVSANTNFGLGQEGNTLSWSFLDSNLNTVNDGIAVHVTILVLGLG
jgi:hypothetical protein